MATAVPSLWFRALLLMRHVIIRTHLRVEDGDGGRAPAKVRARKVGHLPGVRHEERLGVRLALLVRHLFRSFRFVSPGVFCGGAGRAGASSVGSESLCGVEFSRVLRGVGAEEEIATEEIATEEHFCFIIE